MVAATLEELRGPVSGVVELPHRLMWQADRHIDLDDAFERRWLYEMVLREAIRFDELRTWLDGATCAASGQSSSCPEVYGRRWRSGTRCWVVSGQPRDAVGRFHVHIAEIAIAVARQHGFALGGGLALIAHGIAERPTEDVDLFSDRPDSVRATLELVVSALESARMDVTVDDEDSDLGGVINDLDGHMAELTAFRDSEDHVGVLYRTKTRFFGLLAGVLADWSGGPAVLVDRATHYP